jgi:hypothetical protein
MSKRKFIRKCWAANWFFIPSMSGEFIPLQRKSTRGYQADSDFSRRRGGIRTKRDAAVAFDHGRWILAALRVKDRRSTEQLYST